LAGKWKVPIVWYLGLQSQPFAEPQNLLPGVSEKVLTKHLRQVENAGILQRIARVDYKLTATGRDLVPVMQGMCDWGSTHMGIVPNLPRANASERTAFGLKFNQFFEEVPNVLPQ
jgi:DNA-binding HxlR family transcriptional regulator